MGSETFVLFTKCQLQFTDALESVLINRSLKSRFVYLWWQNQWTSMMILIRRRKAWMKALKSSNKYFLLSLHKKLLQCRGKLGMSWLYYDWEKSEYSFSQVELLQFWMERKKFLVFRLISLITVSEDFLLKFNRHELISKETLHKRR